MALCLLFSTYGFIGSLWIFQKGVMTYEEENDLFSLNCSSNICSICWNRAICSSVVLVVLTML